MKPLRCNVNVSQLKQFQEAFEKKHRSQDNFYKISLFLIVKSYFLILVLAPCVFGQAYDVATMVFILSVISFVYKKAELGMRVLFPILMVSNVFAQSYNVSTLAGSGAPGYVDNVGTNAQFNSPFGVAIDSSEAIFVGDYQNHRIRKITSVGAVTTFAGSGAPGYFNDNTTSAQFNLPTAVAIDSTGTLFVVDHLNHCVRKITSAGVVTTFAGSGAPGYLDGNTTSAQFNRPTGVTIDSTGTLFIADEVNNRIRKITSSGVVTTFAGSGAGYLDGNITIAQFNRPTAVTVDSSGTLFVSEFYYHRIRKITSSGDVSTFAGSGVAGYLNGNTTSAQFNRPYGVAVDSSGTLFVADHFNHCIRKITPAGVVTTLAGTGVAGYLDGNATSAQFYGPLIVSVDLSGRVYVAEFLGHRIRKIEPPTELIYLQACVPLARPVPTLL